MIKRKGWLIAAISSIVVLILVLNDIFIKYFFQIFVDQFAIGISDFKLIAFLIYFCCCSLMIAFGFKKKRVNIKKYFVITLCVGMALSFSSYIYFMESFDLDYHNRYDSVHDNGRISSTSLSHSHTFKAPLSVLVGLFNQDLHLNYDAGLFYFNNLPDFFWISGLIILFSLLTLFFLNLINLNYELRRYKDVYLLFFIISSFSLIKNVFDGGIFSTEVIFWSLVFVGTLFHDRYKNFYFKNFLKNSYLIIGVYLLFLYLLYSGDVLYYSISILSMFLFLTVLLLSFVYIKRKRYFYFVNIVLSYFVLFFFLLNFFHYGTPISVNYDNLEFLNKEFSTGTEIFLLLNDGDHISSDLIYHSDSFYFYNMYLNESKTIYQLSKNYGLNTISYDQIKVNGLNCDSNKTSHQNNKVLFIDSSPKKMYDFKQLGLSITFEYLSGGWYDMSVIYGHNCFHKRNIVPILLSGEGLNNFIIEN